MKIQISTIILLGLFLTQFGIAQVYEGDIVLGSQSAINDFKTTCNCTEINGNLKLKQENDSDPYTDFSPMSDLTRITGDLNIEQTTVLENFEGLNSLYEVGGNVIIKFNDSNTSFNGLDGVLSIGKNVDILFNEIAENLNGFSSLLTIGGTFVVQGNDNIASLEGIGSLYTIGGNLRIKDNPKLINLEGLNSMSNIDGDLRVNFNEALQSIDALSDLKHIGDVVYINSNPALDACCAIRCWTFFILDVETFLLVEENATNCNSLEEVDANCEGALCNFITVDWVINGDWKGEATKPVLFQDQTVGDPEPDTWEWDFGDGNTTTGQSPVHVFEKEGVYEVSLTVTSACCTDTKVKAVQIDPNSNPVGFEDIEASSFSAYPNPVIDVLYFDLNATQAQIKIYDASGNMMLEQLVSDQEGVNLNDLPTGIYFIESSTEENTNLQKILKL